MYTYNRKDRKRMRPCRLRRSVQRITLFLFALALPVASLVAFAHAGKLYVGVWQKETGSNIITEPLNFQKFLKRGEELVKQGLRLRDVDTFMTPEGRRYVGVWRNGGGTSLIGEPLGPVQFRKRRTEMESKGLRLVDFEVFAEPGGGHRFLGLWESGTGEELVTGGLSFDAFLARGEKLTKRGLRLVDVEILQSGQNQLYFGLWREATGTNLITGPLARRAFLKKRKEFTAKGLRLVDLEVFRAGKKLRYVGVWNGGKGENRVSRPLSFPDFVKRGTELVSRGFRLTDVEVFDAPRSSPSKPDTKPTPDGEPVDFPPLPAYIDLTGSARIVVDFGTIVDGQPRITLPIDFLDFLPTDPDGNIIFPDNFCGLRVRKASRFVWLKNGSEFDQFPFNNVPEKGPKSSIQKLFGDDFYLGGIDFTGPIGACSGSNENWQFPFPFTKTNEGPGAPENQLRLVIELEQGSEIQFLNFNLVQGEGLPAYELFSDELEEKFRKLAERFAILLEVDSGYCGIDQFLRDMCEEAKEDHKPGECLISDDVESPCG